MYPRRGYELFLAQHTDTAWSSMSVTRVVLCKPCKADLFLCSRQHREKVIVAQFGVFLVEGARADEAYSPSYAHPLHTVSTQASRGHYDC
eukprot:48830-Eustigmatos_ZCMA.PRE.1